LETLLEAGVIPVVNENDTVSGEQIRFGSNDTLSAVVALLSDADLLVNMSDIDGLYTADPRRDPNATLIDCVAEITPRSRRRQAVQALPVVPAAWWQSSRVPAR
jgi:glutamate 5-kinase